MTPVGDQLDIFGEPDDDQRHQAWRKRGDLEAAKARKVRKLARMQSKAFTASVRRVILETWRPGELMSGEHIRFACEDQGVYARHPNCWGAVTNALGNQGLLWKTKERVVCEDPNTNARDTPLWALI